jgi:arylsulfatase A-like enzyme
MIERLAIWGVLLVLSALPAAAQPNIVMILTDDLGIGDIRAYNAQSKIATPHLDALAAEGTLFTDAHDPASVCTPTRYGILTGRYSWRTRLKKGVLYQWSRPLIDDGTITLPEMLKTGGYTTAAIGKWHLGEYWPTTNGLPPIGMGASQQPANSGANVDYSQPITGGPLDHGFDVYFGMGGLPPYAWIDGDRVLVTPTAQKPTSMWGPPGPMSPGWTHEAMLPTVTQKAVEFIQGASAPYFLYFTPLTPHLPINAEHHWIGTSSAGRYGDFVQQMDDSIGRIFDAIEATGQKDNTLVILISDNGGAGFDNNAAVANSLLTKYGHRTNGPYRGLKTMIFEGGLRTPMILRWPGQLAPGTVRSGHWVHLDWMRTLARIADVSVPYGAAPDSFDGLPILTDAPVVGPVRPTTVYHSHNGTFALREGDWKLICGSGNGGSADTTAGCDAYQLYNLATDPSESINRGAAAALASLRNSMRAKLDAIKTSTATHP